MQSGKGPPDTIYECEEFSDNFQQRNSFKSTLKIIIMILNKPKNASSNNVSHMPFTHINQERNFEHYMQETILKIR